MKKKIIIDCTKNSSGTFVPFRSINYRPAKKKIHFESGQNIPDQGIEEFLSGVDAGLDIFEHIVDRLDRFRAR